MLKKGKRNRISRRDHLWAYYIALISAIVGDPSFLLRDINKGGMVTGTGALERDSYDSAGFTVALHIHGI